LSTKHQQRNKRVILLRTQIQTDEKKDPSQL
jgi:hypothetical protein